MEGNLKDRWNHFVGGTFDIDQDHDETFERMKSMGFFGDVIKIQELTTQLAEAKDIIYKATPPVVKNLEDQLAEEKTKNERLTKGIEECIQWDWVYADVDSEDFKQHIEYVESLAINTKPQQKEGK